MDIFKFLKRPFCKHKKYSVLSWAYMQSKTFTSTFKLEHRQCLSCGKKYDSLGSKP